MVVDSVSEAHTDRVFRALADATRRDIVVRTLRQEASVSELAAQYDMSFAAVQKHVAVLEAADLVTKHARGRERIVTGNPETLRKIRHLLGEIELVWRDRITRLDALFDADASRDEPLNDVRKTEPPTAHN